MEPHQPTGSDATLRRVLQEWRLNASLPPRFREQVWQRIARQAAPGRWGLWHAWTAWLEQTVPHPAVAAAYVAVLLGAGLGAGYLQARADNQRLLTNLQVRYLQLVDPLASARD